MKKQILFLSIILASSVFMFGGNHGKITYKLSDLHIRGTFVYPDSVKGTYYLYASITNRTNKQDSIQGVEAYSSKDEKLEWAERSIYCTKEFLGAWICLGHSKCMNIRENIIFLLHLRLRILYLQFRAAKNE